MFSRRQPPNRIANLYGALEHDEQDDFMPPFGTLFGEENGVGDRLSDLGSEGMESEYTYSRTENLAEENRRLRALMGMHRPRVSSSSPSRHSIMPYTKHNNFTAPAPGPVQRNAASNFDVGTSAPSSHGIIPSGPATDRTMLFPERGPDGKVLVLPRREIDYPHAAKFWTRRKFEALQKDEITIPGAVKGRQGPGRLRRNNENVGMQYVINVHGDVIDGDRAEAMRDCMRTWLRDHVDTLPSTWKHGVSESLKVALYEHMYQCFEELQLCDFDWKVERIAIDVFPQLIATMRRQTKASKKKKAKKGKKRPRQSDDEASEKDTAADFDLAGYEIIEIEQERRSSFSPIGSQSATKRPRPASSCDELPPPTHDDPPPTLPGDSLPNDTAPARSGSPSLNDTPTRGHGNAALTSAANVNDSPPSGLEVLATAATTVTKVPGQQDVHVAARPELQVDGMNGGPMFVIPDPLSGMWDRFESASEHRRSPSPTASITEGLDTPATAAPPVPDTISIAPPSGTSAASTFPASTEISPAAAAAATSGPALSSAPKKSTNRASGPRVWPPTPSKEKPKDKCARIWSARNPGGTEDEFDKFYKEKIPSWYFRNKYIQSNGDMEVPPSKKRAARAAAKEACRLTSFAGYDELRIQLNEA